MSPDDHDDHGDHDYDDGDSGDHDEDDDDDDDDDENILSNSDICWCIKCAKAPSIHHIWTHMSSELKAFIKLIFLTKMSVLHFWLNINSHKVK